MAASKFGKRGAAAPAQDEGIDPLASAFLESEVGGAKEPLFPLEQTLVVEFRGLERQPVVPGKSAWLKGKFYHEEHGDLAVLWCLDNKSLGTTLPKIKACICAVIGCPDAESYAEFDPKGKFFSAMLGLQNELSETAAGYIGAKVKTYAGKGNPTKDGTDFYREHSWFAVEEGS